MIWYSIGHTKIVYLLIKSGASINLVDKSGNSALHLAAINGKLINILIVRNVLVENSAKNHLDKENVADLLLKNGANAEIRDKDGKTALQLAVQFGRLERH